MDSNFWFGISSGILIGIVIMGITFIAINSNRVLLKENDWKCAQSRILEPDDVDKIECVVYKKVIKNEISR